MAGTPFSSFEDGGNPVTGDKVVGLRAGINTIFDFSIAEWGYNITQAAHGFVGGNVLRLNSTTYVLAQADSAANAEVVGIVSAVISPDEFQLQVGGLVEDLAGLVAGSIYYLDPATAGALTVIEPTTPTQINKPILIANSTTSGFWVNWRGQVL